MDCPTLVHAHLLSSGLDPDEVRYGQLLTLLVALVLVLVAHLLPRVLSVLF